MKRSVMVKEIADALETFYTGFSRDTNLFYSDRILSAIETAGMRPPQWETGQIIHDPDFGEMPVVEGEWEKEDGDA